MADETPPAPESASCPTCHHDSRGADCPDCIGPMDVRCGCEHRFHFTRPAPESVAEMRSAPASAPPRPRQGGFGGSGQR